MCPIPNVRHKINAPFFADAPFSCLFSFPVIQSLSVNGMQCEGERPDTTIRKINRINNYDDENQIARESVFRAERIPERIDRPLSVLCPDADCQHSV